MDHISEDQLVDLVTGLEDPEVRVHVGSCGRCRSRYELWLQRIEDLRDVTREGVDEREIHRLAVLYRQLGPGRDRARSWVARLVRASSWSAAPAAVRGVAAGQLMEYSAGSHSVLLRVGARGSRPTVSVVGQIEAVDGDAEVGGAFALLAAEGETRIADVDRFGEFHLEGIEPGSYTGTWCFEDRVLVVPGVEIGTDDEA